MTAAGTTMTAEAAGGMMIVAAETDGMTVAMTIAIAAGMMIATVAAEATMTGTKRAGVDDRSTIAGPNWIPTIPLRVATMMTVVRAGRGDRVEATGRLVTVDARFMRTKKKCTERRTWA
jgi:hypothetical protein